MLLFVRNPYFAAIKAGLKTFEVRAGTRYARVAVGDKLSINGRFSVIVVRREAHATIESLIEALKDSNYPLTKAQVIDCYPNGPKEYYIFWFEAPPPEHSMQVCMF